MGKDRDSQREFALPQTVKEIEDSCDRFEAAWRAGQQVKLESFVADWSGHHRRALLARLLPIELDGRRRRREHPTLEEYHRRFPNDGPVIAEAFADTESRLSRALGDPRQVSISQFPSTAEGTLKAGKELQDVPVQIPGYEMQGEIDRGGMGLILRGRDPKLGRELAFKVIRNKLRSNPSAVSRFVAEAQITGQLQHPGIAPVHELGRCEDGRPYFSMKLIQGHNLERLLKERSSPSQDLPRFLKIFEQICQTIAFAHSRGVVHRDLKPLNVMVGAFGELQIMDWGLATRLHGDPSMSAEELARLFAESGGDVAGDPGTEDPEDTEVPFDSDDGEQLRLTQEGQVVGTFPYVPPEQARGEVDHMDERCDVFGLGAILCEILTGRPPYTGESSGEIVTKARAGDLTQAMSRLDQCRADPQLITLARLCLAPDPKDRARDGQVVADVVTNYLVDQQYFNTRRQIETKVAHERKRLVRHYRRVTAVVCLLLALPLLVGGLFLLFALFSGMLHRLISV
jgi:serine/threonine protein kinase